LSGKPIGKLTRLIAGILLLGGCGRIQQRMGSMQDSSRFSLTDQEESFTFKNESIHYNPSMLQVGTTRQQVVAAFGNPNSSQTTGDGQVEDVYAFNPDGSKFVNPQTQARNIAAAVFTAGTSVAVRQARIKMTEDKLTLFHVVYSPDETIQRVSEERLSNAPESLPPQPVTNSGIK
jgi:outer membrane protein assembly factor BamE (lipoprotein component of BamABCDE complex)